jgi:hypothetical protein
MFAFVAGHLPVRAARAAIGPIVVAAAMCAAGCAADNNIYYASSPAVAGYVAQAPSVQVEDDGLPSQAPPSARIRQMPDDPSEPYSRNYGGQNPGVREPASAKPAAQAAAAEPVIPEDLPADFRRQLAAAVDTAQ